jgi:uncharacterized protein (TIGR02757 family)
MFDVKEKLDALYRRFNRRAFVHPDPLETVYRYDSPGDQEIAGLIAATLAYGRVAQILTSIGRVLDVFGDDGPRAWLLAATARQVRARFSGFKHRFTTGREMSSLLLAVKRAIEEQGTLCALFLAGVHPGEETHLSALALFVDQVRRRAGGTAECPSLLSSPEDGSACKRLNLYLRWMIRHDAVDPGPWTGRTGGAERIAAAGLVVPLDTHMFRIGRGLGFTARRQPNLATALEVTRALRRYAPRDPVRYDFSLTRLGINPACRDEEIERLLKGRE